MTNETATTDQAWITGKIARIGSYTDPVARKSPKSDEVSIETVIHFMLENDATIYTTYISYLSSREKAASIAMSQIGDEVAFCMIDREEVGDFANLILTEPVRIFVGEAVSGINRVPE